MTELAKMTDLEGKTAYITGSGRGIGRAIALKLASEGVNIVVNDLDDAPAQEVCAAVEALGAKALPLVGSVVAPDFAERFIDQGVKTFGGVDIIVNNAGYTWDSLVHKMTDEQFDAMIDVHLKAPFQILRAAGRFIIPAAKEEQASGQEKMRKVINISSVAGTGGNVGQVNYSSAKAGMTGLTKTLAKEWGRYKVTVNCIAFGLNATRLTEATDEKKTVQVDGKQIGVGIPTKVVSAFETMIPLGRRGTVEEAAGSVYLLCRPEANYISGQTLIVGGGFTL